MNNFYNFNNNQIVNKMCQVKSNCYKRRFNNMNCKLKNMKIDMLNFKKKKINLKQKRKNMLQKFNIFKMIQMRNIYNLMN